VLVAELEGDFLHGKVARSEKLSSLLHAELVKAGKRAGLQFGHEQAVER
jgi:hypothetical protein